ncbi:predicted protein [Streptomyces iranensis]|uniref:Uncharacterized protein n=1 Tax=Streptomyces iranensis TaxID=576784 RepID=A0A061A2D4_9ACTN|nr:predicted protein [Streptomyces iranensis]
MLPSGTRYWTVVDDDFEVVKEADRFLRQIRLARGRAETTTKAYAEGVALFLRWCLATGRDWRTAAREMGLFMLWLKWTPGRGGDAPVVVPGPGSKPIRGEIRVNKVLTAVRMFLLYAVTNKLVPAWVLEQIYEVGDTRDLPEAAQGESDGMRLRLRARHRVQEPETDIDRASDEEVVAMFLACRSARDRLTLRLSPPVGRRRSSPSPRVTSCPLGAGGGESDGRSPRVGEGGSLCAGRGESWTVWGSVNRLCVTAAAVQRTLHRSRWSRIERDAAGRKQGEIPASPRKSQVRRVTGIGSSPTRPTRALRGQIPS